MLYDTLENWK